MFLPLDLLFEYRILRVTIVLFDVDRIMPGIELVALFFKLIKYGLTLINLRAIYDPTQISISMFAPPV